MSKLELEPEHRRAYSMAEVAELCGASLPFVKKAVASGEIPSQKIGGRRFVSADALDSILTAGIPA
jgi:excisionase family DNA binding protein